MSGVPPGKYGTTKRIGLEGKSLCAKLAPPDNSMIGMIASDLSNTALAIDGGKKLELRMFKPPPVDGR